MAVLRAKTAVDRAGAHRQKASSTAAGSGVGGVIGVNTATGTPSPASGSMQGDIIAAITGLTVRGSSMVGGIA